MKRFYKPVSKETIGSSNAENTSNIRSEKRPRQEVEFSDDDVVSDPGLRKTFKLVSVDKRDLLRRRYLVKGPCQPRGHEFPLRKGRRFQECWYDRFSWLDYSVSKDKAYCLWCYLFPDEASNKTGDFAFSETGFSNWKKGKDSLAAHEASQAHKNAQSDVLQFKNQEQNIDVVLTKQKAEVQDEYRTRLTTVVRIARYLLGEGLAFRGHDESEDSIHRGHFLELVDCICLFNEEVDKVMRRNAPKNNQLTSSTIQRDLISCCAKETRKMILKELGDRKFALLLDESRDSSIKEQMAVVVRYVNDFGEVIERFLGVVHVTETSSQGLKNAVDDFFAQNGLSISRLRGQGYDGASNMRGELNGLKTLILNDNRNAHYIHCFAHQIQLVVVSIAEDNHDVSQFFDYVLMIVNMVGSSCKRLDALRKSQYEAVLEKIQSGEISTGSGKNQEMSLVRPGSTRWGSHYKTLIRLFGMWNSIEEVLLTIKNDGDSRKTKGTAKGLVEKMGTFEFVFIGKLMLEILSYFEPLSSALQAKDQDIGNAICMVETLKEKLQSLRDGGWEKLLNEVVAFCDKHNISVPSLEDRLPSRCVSLVNGEPKTLFHFFRFEIMNEVVDAIFVELNRRFTEANTDLLQCIMCLNPSKSFSKFNVEALVHLARMYPDDFSQVDVMDLSYQLRNYINAVRSNSNFLGLEDLGSLSKTMVENNFHKHFALVYRLIELALILPVATASVERAFSAMNIVKTDLRNKLGDALLSDCLLCYIEKNIFFSVDEEDIMQCFQKSASRRNVLPPLRISGSSSRSVNQI